MRWIFTLVFLLASGIVFAGVTVNGVPQFTGAGVSVQGQITQTQDGIEANVATQTSGDIDLYVETTGSDSNDCLSSGNACLTIKEAVSRIPKHANHDVTVTVGSGTFTGFLLEGFHIGFEGSLVVQGTLGNFSPATGTAAGTADGGDTDTCTDSGQSWTTDDLKGKLALVNSEYRPILSNTGTSFEVLGAFSATCNGKAYVVQEQKTTLNAKQAESLWAVVEGHANSVAGDTYTDTDNFLVRDFKIDGVSGTYDGFDVLGGHCIASHRNFIDGGYYGAVFQDCWGAFRWAETWLEDSTLVGANFLRVTQAYIHRSMFRNNGGEGLWADACQSLDLKDLYAEDHANDAGFLFRYNQTAVQSGGRITSDDNKYGVETYHNTKMDFGELDCTNNSSHGAYLHGDKFVDIDTNSEFSSNTGYGVYIDENTTGNRWHGGFVNMNGTITVSSNTAGGIIGRNQSVIALTDVDGSGNGTYGLELETGSSATVTTDTGVTGTSGDATIDDGNTTLTWATDFASNEDAVINGSTFSRIERRD
jgi:hypothetical protein